MLRPRRLTLCYVAPGASYRRGSGHSRQVLTLARALARDAEVTVVFRRLIDEVDVPGVSVAALESDRVPASDLAPSRRALGLFVQRRASAFGMVLEGSWAMSGKLAAWCAQRGVPAISVLDRFPAASWLGSLEGGNTWLGFRASGRYLRQASDVVAGSAVIRDALVERWRLSPDRITVIGPAIDRTTFAPKDQTEARRRLGLDPTHRIVLAADGLERGTDLAPLIEAVQRVGDPSLRLHVLGHGERRKTLERLAGPGALVTFHAPTTDEALAAHIAAADLCVSSEAGDPAFTVLECLSSARPVAVPAVEDRPPVAVRHLVTGFLVQHDVLAWIRFLQRDCPSRNNLRMMGLAAGATPIDHADRIAAAYLAVVDRATRSSARPVVAV